jgi:hypothetical protein
MLTQTGVKAALPKSKPYKLADFAGLHLLVRPNGSRLWRFRYQFDGREKLISFGPYPQVSLAAARIQRDHVRAQLRSGIDPMHARRRQVERDRARRAARDFRLVLTDSGELTVSTRYLSMRLTAKHTAALRAFLIAASEPSGASNASE